MKFSTTASSISALIFLQFLSQNWTYVLNSSEEIKAQPFGLRMEQSMQSICQGGAIYSPAPQLKVGHISKRYQHEMNRIPQLWCGIQSKGPQATTHSHTQSHTRTETERETFWANIWHQKNLLTVKLVIHTHKHNQTHTQTNRQGHSGTTKLRLEGKTRYMWV